MSNAMKVGVLDDATKHVIETQLNVNAHKRTRAPATRSLRRKAPGVCARHAA